MEWFTHVKIKRGEIALKKSEFGNRWLFRILSILLVACLISSVMVSRLYARYISSAAHSDSGRVAAFDVRQTGELTAFFHVSLAPGQSSQKTVIVQNSSEVAILYSVAVENAYNNLPLTFTINGNPLPYQEQIPCNRNHGQTLTLEIVWPAEVNDASYIGKVDLIKITLNATQAD